MIRYILDTNICIALIRQRDLAIRERLVNCTPGTVALSAVTLAELEFGIQKSAQTDRNRIALAAFTAQLQVLPFGANAAAHYGDIRAVLQRAGIPIGPLDTMIAAHAQSIGATVVTNNEREFRRVEGLDVENWLGES